MSNESNRIGIRTAGNANLLSILGDILSSDGIQSMRVPLGLPGQFLCVDLTAECGLAYKSAGDAGALTFSDGVTLTVANVTNDLVTGTSVAQVDAVATGGAVDAINLNATDGGFIASNDSGSRFVIGIAGDIQITGSGASGAGDMTLSTSTGNDITLDTAGTGDIILTPAHDELHTVGRNFELSAAGAAGVAIVATVGDININPTNNDIILRAGDAGGTGAVSVQPGTTSATRTFQIFNGAGSGQQTVLSPSGGATVDTECRAKLDELLEALHLWGWLAQPNP